MAAASVLVASCWSPGWLGRCAPAVAWLLVFAVGLLTAAFFAAGGGRSPRASLPTRRFTAPRSASSSPGRCWVGPPCPRPSATWPVGIERAEEHGVAGADLAVLVVLAATLYYLPVIVKWF